MRGLPVQIFSPSWIPVVRSEIMVSHCFAMHCVLLTFYIMVSVVGLFTPGFILFDFISELFIDPLLDKLKYYEPHIYKRTN